MKKWIFLAFMAITLSLNAQNQKMVEKATGNSEYVAKAMDLNDTEKQFLYASLLDSYQDAAERKKGLTDDEKKQVNQEIRKELKQELGKVFSKDEVKEIFALIKEKRENEEEGSSH